MFTEVIDTVSINGFVLELNLTTWLLVFYIRIHIMRTHAGLHSTLTPAYNATVMSHLKLCPLILSRVIDKLHS